jgi:hypothetical protein
MHNQKGEPEVSSQKYQLELRACLAAGFQVLCETFQI